jgi:hypothetical protein
MPALDLRILIVTPYALAVAFLLWVLWNFIQEGFKKKSPAPSRLVSISRAQTPGAAQVFSFPESRSTVPDARNSGTGARPQPQPSSQGSLSPQRLTGVATR